MSQAASASFSIVVRESSTEGGRLLQDKFTLAEAITFLDATGLLGCPKVFADRRTLNSTTENLDLSGLLESGIGTATVFTKIRILAIRWNGDTGTLKADGGATAGAVGLLDGSITVGAGGWIIILDPTLAGRAITATTADILAMTSTATGTYDFIAGGE